MKVSALVSGERGSKTGLLVITGIIHFNHQVHKTIEFVSLSLVLRQFENAQTFTAHTDTTESGSVPSLIGLMHSNQFVKYQSNNNRIYLNSF